MTLGLYVGSFDPITLGHLDVIRQAMMVFENIHIGIGINPNKTSRFTLEERTEMIKLSVRESGLPLNRISVGTYRGSMMQEARDRAATSIVRGLRQMSDFNDEFLINGMVARTLPEVPMSYFICRQDYLHVSSSAVKQLADLNEDFSWMVTESVSPYLNRTFKVEDDA